MAAKRPKRRVVQPCLEYNGGLLHKEELQLRRALYASLVDSKKMQGNPKNSRMSSATEGSTSMDSFSLNNALTDGDSNATAGVEVHNNDCNNCTQPEKQSSGFSSKETQSEFEVRKGRKGKSWHRNNYHNKTYKFRQTTLELELPSLHVPSCVGEVSVNKVNYVDYKAVTGEEGGTKKRRRRKKNLKESIADESSASKNNRTLMNDAEAIPRRTLKVIKKRKRRQNGKGSSDVLGICQLESPSKKLKKEDKRIHKDVQAQRKFASSHPLNPSSVKLQQEPVHMPTMRAKTENFLDFLCLRGQPFLPEELELFNTPCAPMSPLSSDGEHSFFSPSPSQSTDPSPVPSSLLENPPKSSGSPSLSSVDSPATGDAPVWESGVMRMYASGPKRRITKEAREQHISDISPSISPDDVGETIKSVTPPLAFRVSPCPTPLRSGTQKQNLPRPIPGPPIISTPFITIPSSSDHHSVYSDSSLPPLPPLITSSVCGAANSKSCEKTCCTPPPLLYIPAAAQRVTHLHGPPELKRFPPTGVGVSEFPGKKDQCEVVGEVETKSRPSAPEDPPLLTKFTDITASNNQVPSLDSTKTSPPLLQKFASSSNKEKVISCKEELLPQQGTVEALDDGCPQVTKFRTIEHHQQNLIDRAPSSCAGMKEKLPNLNHYPYHTASSDQEHHMRTPLSRQNDNPPTLERFSSVSDTRQTQNPVVLPSEGQSPVLFDKSERSPFPRQGYSNLTQNEHGALSGCRQEIRPLPSDRKCLTSPAGKGYSSPGKSCKSSAGQVSTDRRMRFSRPNVGVQLSPPCQTGRDNTASRSLKSSAFLDTHGFQPVKNEQLRVVSDRSGLCSSVQSNCDSSLGTHLSNSSLHTSTLSPHPQTSRSRSCLVASSSTCCPQVTSLYTGKMTTETDVTSRTHVTPSVPKNQFALQGDNDIRVVHSLSSKSSPEFMKSRYVSRASSVPSNTFPQPWSHVVPSYSHSSRSTSSEPPKSCTVTLAMSNSLPKAVFSSTNHSLVRIKPDCLKPVSPVRAVSVSVIRSVDSRCDAAPEDFLLRGIEDELASTAQGESSTGELYPSHTVPLSVSLPHALQSPLLTSANEMQPKGDVCVGNLGRISGRSVVETMSLNTPSTNAAIFKGIIAPVKRRKGRLVGRRARSVQNSSVSSEQVTSRDNKSVSVSTSTLSKLKMSANEGLKKRRAFGENVGVPWDSLEDPCSLVFHPSEEEFRDPVLYIKSIRSRAERFGLCVVVPPESWKPEFQISENLRFSSQCQLVHRLKERWGPVEKTLACIRKHLEQQSILLTPFPQIGGYELDLPQFSKVVTQLGGMQKVIDTNKWNRVADLLRIPKAAQDRIGKLQDAYCKYLLSYDLLPKEEKDALETQVLHEREARETEGTVLDSDAAVLKGRNISMISFQRFSRNILARLFKGMPSIDEVEKEFWNTVHDRDRYVSVYKGVINTGQHGSSFPCNKNNAVLKCGWNLDVLPLLPGSLLKHLGSVQDITVPWLQIDMMFSANTWQTHPLALHTVDYLHTGSDRVWYCVPSREHAQFVSVMESFRSAVCADDPHVPMVSPDSLRDHGLTVTRVVQKQGQFVVVFPKTFYSNLASGYAISEAVSFAPTEWLLYGPSLWQQLRDEPDWREFAYEKLLLGLAEEDMENLDKDVVNCLLDELKVLREAEDSALKALFALGLSGTENIGRKHTLADEGNQALDSPWSLSDAVLYCEECNKPCCVSAVMNETGPVVLCLTHAAVALKKEISVKDFKILSRYDVARIDALISRVQGKSKQFESPEKEKGSIS